HGSRSRQGGRSVPVPGPGHLLLRRQLQGQVRRRSGAILPRQKVITSPYLAGRDRYERVTEGWGDNTHEDAFTYTVRLADDDHSVEVSAVCTPSPAYEVRCARARVLGGPEDPVMAAAFGGIAGARMVAGFGRRLADLTGRGPGAELLVDAGIEVARLARQVT